MTSVNIYLKSDNMSVAVSVRDGISVPSSLNFDLGGVASKPDPDPMKTIRQELSERPPSPARWQMKFSAELIEGGQSREIEGGVALSVLMDITLCRVSLLHSLCEQAFGKAVEQGLTAAPQAVTSPQVATATAPPPTHNASVGTFAGQLDPVILSDGTDFYPRLRKQGPGCRPETDREWVQRCIRDTSVMPSVPQHMMLWGGAGTGKTVLAEAAVGAGFEKASFSSGTEQPGIVGYEKYSPDPATVGQLVPEMVKAALLRAYTHEHDSVCAPDYAAGKYCPYAFCLLDEVNTLAPDVMPELHPFLDGSGSITFEGVTYRRGSPDFTVMGTGNEYAGPLTLALKSRLANQAIVYPSPFVARKRGVPEPLVDFLQKCIVSNESGTGRAVPSIRDLLKCVRQWEFAPSEGWRTLLDQAPTEKDSEEWLTDIRDMVDSDIAQWLEAATKAIISD